MQREAEIKTTVITLHDHFYRDGFRVILLSLGMMAAAIILLIIISLYFFLHQVLPVSLPVYDGWRVQKEVPVTEPYLRVPDLLQWVSTALPSIFISNFVYYDRYLKIASRYFTETGFAKYKEALNIFMNPEEVLKNKLFVQATAAGAPVILNQGIVEGKYAWWVQMPIDVRYSNVDGGSHTTQLIIQVLVTRIPTLNNLEGVSIENMIITRS